MKKWLFLAIFVLFSCLAMPVGAQTTAEETVTEQLEALGADELFDSLPPKTQNFLRRIGITQIADLTAESDSRSWLAALSEWTKSGLLKPLQQGSILLAVVLLCALVDSMHITVGEQGGITFQTLSVAAMAVALLPFLSGVIQSAADSLESLEVFMLSFVPVYAAALLASGSGAVSIGYQGVVLAAAEVLGYVNQHLLLPISTASFALGMAGGVNRELKTEAISTRISRFCTWGVGIIASVFSGLLTVKTIVDGASDTVGKKFLKLTVSNMIPVVGGALSEAVNTVAGCLSVARTTVGAFGMIVCGALVVPTALELLGWSVILSVALTVSEMFALESIIALLKAAAATVKLLLALLCVQGLFMILTVAIVLMTGGGA